MDLDNDEELVTKQHNKQVRYIKLLAEGKGLTHNQFKSFYGDYEELYDLLCEYMNRYNRLEEENEELKKVKEQSQEILSSIKIIYMVHTKDCELTLKDIEKWEKILDK